MARTKEWWRLQRFAGGLSLRDGWQGDYVVSVKFRLDREPDRVAFYDFISTKEARQYAADLISYADRVDELNQQDRDKDR